jgi:hypothetical protein
MVAESPVTISCTVNGIPVAPQTFQQSGNQTFEATIPGDISVGEMLHFDFVAEHKFAPELDPRELGVIVPFTGTKLPAWFG